ncbi:hypothetical protein [Burkholderia multivorans]|uniref:hypothetical protein n=1 Tax=Burkholderia multivorans TaxID=87883 RepID=UPI0021C1387B|nr:hypothetical protein [Burkholderia multivorans]
MIDTDKMKALAAKLRSMPKAYDVELPTAVEAADAINLLLAELKAAAADKRDAERYRTLRRGQHWSVLNGIGDTLRADELDAAIDAALAQRQGEGS